MSNKEVTYGNFKWWLVAGLIISVGLVFACVSELAQFSKSGKWFIHPLLTSFLALWGTAVFSMSAVVFYSLWRLQNDK